MQVIIYSNSNHGVSVVVPCDCGLTVEEIAKKDVPGGVEYKIIDDSELPDRATRDQWTMLDGKVVVSGDTAEDRSQAEGN